MLSLLAPLHSLSQSLSQSLAQGLEPPSRPPARPAYATAAAHAAARAKAGRLLEIEEVTTYRRTAREAGGMDAAQADLALWHTLEERDTDLFGRMHCLYARCA